MITKARKQNDPVVSIIFGASGDLCKRKLMPSLFHLYKNNSLPEDFKVVGFGRTEYSDSDFQKHLISAYNYDAYADEAEGSDDKTSLKTKNTFFANIHYFKGHYDVADDYVRLKTFLQNFPQCQMFYLAIPPQTVHDVCLNLKEHIICKDCKGIPDCASCSKENKWSRIILEKPFGHDYQSASELNKFLTGLFHENQLFRIDHYLGKETVQNLMAFRFGNNIFEPLWNHKYIDYVEIEIAETLTVEQRGSYFETTGIVKDIIQNHALQVLSLIAMEPPPRFTPKAIRSEKYKLLDSVAIPNPEEVIRNTLRGQYEGYLKESGVNPHSKTETYAVIKLFIQNFRWARTPFIIKAGKALDEKITRVNIYFKEVDHKLFQGKNVCGVEPNILTFTIQPKEGIHLQFFTKNPGNSFDLKKVDMNFTYEEQFTERIFDAYERLILDVFSNDPSLFISNEEVEASWNFIDAILNVWKNDSEKIPLFQYAKGTKGPEEVNNFAIRDGKTWNNYTCALTTS